MVTGPLRLHDTWHVSSSAVSRSPATVLEPRMPQLYTEIEMTTCGKERNYTESSTWAVCESRLESSHFASDLSISLMQRRPQIHYKPIIWAGPGLRLGIHSWTAVLNPQRGTNRKFENRIHTWVTLGGFGWINELSGSLSTCWEEQSFTILC